MAHAIVRCPETNVEFRITHRSKWHRMLDTQWRASFEISVGNPACSGRYLETLLHWASTRFDSFQFSIADTLATYNYTALGHPVLGRQLNPVEAETVALGEGNAWLTQNKLPIREILGNSDVSIVRWDTWRHNPQVQSALKRMRAIHSSDAYFRSIVTEDVDAYMARRGRLVTHELTERCRSQLANYILEELSVRQVQLEEAPTVSIYPGGMLRVLRRLPTFDDMPESLLNWQYVYFEFRDLAGGSTQQQRETVAERGA